MNAQPSAVRADAAPAAPVLLRGDVGEVAVLTLNRPEARNSLSDELLAALSHALAAIAADRSVRVVVLAANGPAFCAGHDLKELTALRAERDKGRAAYAALFRQCSALMQQ